MIDHLSLAALAPSAGVSYQTDWPLLIMMAGFITLHALLPLIAGVIYASHLRTLSLWVAALAVASFAIHAGQELRNMANYGDYGTVSGVMSQGALFVFVPAFGSAAFGALIRGIWDHFATKRITAGVQK